MNIKGLLQAVADSQSFTVYDDELTAMIRSTEEKYRRKGFVKLSDEDLSLAAGGVEQFSESKPQEQ